MKFVCAGLREYFDSAESQLVVLGRKRILVDADLTDRVFLRKFTATESVDENRSAVRTGRRARERLQIVAIYDQSVGICRSFRADPRACIRIDGYPLSNDYNF